MLFLIKPCPETGAQNSPSRLAELPRSPPETLGWVPGLRSGSAAGGGVVVVQGLNSVT